MGRKITKCNFEVGDKVIYSDEGKKELNPKNKDRIGVIIRKSHNPTYVNVQWNGTNSLERFHYTFIRKITKEMEKLSKRFLQHKIIGLDEQKVTNNGNAVKED